MADFDRGNAQGLHSLTDAQSSVGHSRRQYNDQGARVQRDQFLTQELTWFVLDTGLPANGHPSVATPGNQNANIYLTGFEANGDPRAGERILQVLSAHMNPVIIEAIEDNGNATPANRSGNSRLLYFACESDGLHWDVDPTDANATANASNPDYYGEIGANTDAGRAEMSTAAKAIRAIRAITDGQTSDDLASAKLSRGHFRVTSNLLDNID